MRREPDGELARLAWQASTFGLARDAGEAQLTRRGDFIGTVPYMSVGDRHEERDDAADARTAGGRGSTAFGLARARTAFLGEVLGERAALVQLHGDPARHGVPAVRMHVDDAGVPEPSADPGFALESRASLLVPGEDADDLERNAPTKRFLLGLEDAPHAAPPYQAEDAEVAHALRHSRVGADALARVFRLAAQADGGARVHRAIAVRAGIGWHVPS